MNDLFSHADTDTGPVECLGHKFPSDKARREHYLNLLAQKLKDPTFRNQEGFPIASDKTILELSDPPYYTACPNPFLADFVNVYSSSYCEDSNHEFIKPFTADVSEGKNDPIYNAHSYHTKVPHKAIMRYILHYTKPGDIVLDSFCGTGMTGVAAQLCESKIAVENLGYKVDENGLIFEAQQPDNKIEQKAFSSIGARIPILNDLSTAGR